MTGVNDVIIMWDQIAFEKQHIFKFGSYPQIMKHGVQVALEYLHNAISYVPFSVATSCHRQKL